MAKQRIIALVGPTSSGKSALAVELARKFNGEIISADARQVYRGLNIGTGKITRREMHGVRHHLLDVANPKKIFTAHDFVTYAKAALCEIAQRDTVAIVCGGTGFYIDALLGRIVLPDVPANPKLRAKLEKRTAETLFSLLQKRDSRRAKTIDPRNKRRLIRALEIANQLGRNPLPKKNSAYEVLWLGLRPTPDELRALINKRLHERLKHGMIAEARNLHHRGLSYKRMHELGLEYRSLAKFLQKIITRSELETELQYAIWHYAKRQLTYWRRNKAIPIRWLEPKRSRAALQAVSAFLKH